MRTGLNHQVLDLLGKGLSPSEVAAQLGVLPEYVRATRRRHGGGQARPEYSRDKLEQHKRMLLASLERVNKRLKAMQS